MAPSDSPYRPSAGEDLNGENLNWIVIARPHDLEEARALCDLLNEAGCGSLLVDKYAPNRVIDIDLTIGDVAALRPWGVAVPDFRLPAATALLQEQITIDESDPLLTYSREELKKIAEAPMDGNLVEKILAARLLEQA